MEPKLQIILILDFKLNIKTANLTINQRNSALEVPKFKIAQQLEFVKIYIICEFILNVRNNLSFLNLLQNNKVLIHQQKSPNEKKILCQYLNQIYLNQIHEIRQCVNYRNTVLKIEMLVFVEVITYLFLIKHRHDFKMYINQKLIKNCMKMAS